MRFSAFSPFGMFGFSGQEPLAKRIYLSLVSGQREAFDLSKGTYQECKLYAMAMGLARARLTLERADNQRLPLKAIEKLPSLERDFGCHPSARDTVRDRQAVVAARKGLAKGSRTGAIVAALQGLLGAEFVAYRTRQNAAERVTFPSSNPGDVGTYAKASNTLKVLRIVDPIVTLGVAVKVGYELVNASEPPQVGERLTIEPEISGIAEAVTVANVSGATLTATFTKAHTAGCLAQNGPCPIYMSTQREVVIVLKTSAARDPEKRRKVNDIMARAVRGVTRWQIAEESTALHIGPFVVGTSKVGTVPIGAAAFAF